ncbi:MAG: hypothetical protein AAF705_12935, partial [Bacteroidota bacterium]
MLSICFLVAALFFASCEKEDLNEDQIAVMENSDPIASATLRGGDDSTGMTSEDRCMRGDTVENLRRLPDPILRYIRANYDSAPETAVIKGRRAISVKLFDGTIVLFSRKGRFIGECGGTAMTPEERCMRGDT